VKDTTERQRAGEGGGNDEAKDPPFAGRREGWGNCKVRVKGTSEVKGEGNDKGNDKGNDEAKHPPFA
jgi:hypothetical protein